jgi:poly(A) polymerase-like protein
MQTLPPDVRAMPSLFLPAWPIRIVQSLSEQRIWLAGGPVRDLILDRVPRDWDFVVDGGAIKLARAVANALGGAFYPLDAVRGTGRAIVRAPDTQTSTVLDFAELRGSDILDDLRLRDFTINAMALTLDGQLFDPTSGQQDLACGCIRMTDPNAFIRDPARLVRAIRQAVQLHFTLEPKTHQQLRRDAAAINDVASERVRTELVKLLQLPEASRGLYKLDEVSLLEHILPEVHSVCASPAPAAGGACSPGDGSELVRIGELINTVDRLAAVAGCAADLAPAPLPENLERITSYLTAALSDLSLLLTAYLQEPVSAEATRRDLLKWCALFLRTGITEPDADAPAALTASLCAASARAASSYDQIAFLSCCRGLRYQSGGRVLALWATDRRCAKPTADLHIFPRNTTARRCRYHLGTGRRYCFPTQGVA